jgi:hypothetical protein
MTESRNDGEDKRKVIKGGCAGCVEVAVSGDLKRRRTAGVVEEAGDLNRPARLGAKDVPAWNWDLWLSHSGRDSLTMARKGKRRGKVREGRKETKEKKEKRAVVVRARGERLRVAYSSLLTVDALFSPVRPDTN